MLLVCEYSACVLGNKLCTQMLRYSGTPYSLADELPIKFNLDKKRNDNQSASKEKGARNSGK